MQHLTALTLVVLSAGLLSPGLVFSQSSNSQAQQLFEQARQAHAEGDAQKATDLYRRAIEADPNFIDAYIKLSELLSTLSKFAEAKTVLQKAKEVAPSRGDVRAWLVYVLFGAGAYSEVVNEGNDARSLLSPDDRPVTFYYVGLAHARLGNLEEASRWLEEVASMPAAGTLGGAQAALIDVYQRMLAQRHDPEIALKLGILLYELRNDLEALAVLQTVTLDAPRLAPAFYWLGRTNIRIAEGFTSPDVRRRYQLEARRALERYLELAPNGEFATDARRLLQTLPIALVTTVGHSLQDNPLLFTMESP